MFFQKLEKSVSVWQYDKSRQKKAGVVRRNIIVVVRALLWSCLDMTGTVCAELYYYASSLQLYLPQSSHHKQHDHSQLYLDLLLLPLINLNLPKLIRKEVDRVSYRGFYVFGDYQIVVKQVIVSIDADLIHSDKNCDLGRVMCLVYLKYSANVFCYVFVYVMCAALV